MILSNTDILEILKNPRNANIKDWKAQHAVLDIYVNGGDVASELEKIKNYENTEQKTLREKLARSTKDKVSNLLSPSNKVFNANGGSLSIEGISKTSKDKFQDYISQIPEGISMREWMESYWKDAFISDPNSVMLIEVNAKGDAYPTYKSISVIHDYVAEWDSLEYLVLLAGELTDKEEKIQLYRVYDDEKDALYYLKNEQLVEYGAVEGEVNPNRFNHSLGYVPAVISGGIIDKKTKGKLPFIHNISEALTEYMRESSVFVIYKFLHLFPIFWHYAVKCVTCEGTGRVMNADKTDKDVCPTCKGSRLKVTKDVSDGIRLPIPRKDEPSLAGNVAGYIDTPIVAWKQMKEDLKDLLEEMQFTLWGAYLADQKDKEKTAYETHINAQPINETLWGISRCAETKESQLLTFMARIMHDDKAEVNSLYGKRFVIETPDTLWKKYLDAKTAQAPITTLDYHYEQYLMAEYQNDIPMLQERKKIFSIEPFAHYSMKDLKDVATLEQQQKKLIFSQWITTDINFEKDAITLTKDFETYYTTHQPKTMDIPDKNGVSKGTTDKPELL